MKNMVFREKGMQCDCSLARSPELGCFFNIMWLTFKALVEFHDVLKWMRNYRIFKGYKFYHVAA